MILLTPELAAISDRVLGKPIASLKHKHAEIIQAPDMIFSGI